MSRVELKATYASASTSHVPTLAMFYRAFVLVCIRLVLAITWTLADFASCPPQLGWLVVRL